MKKSVKAVALVLAVTACLALLVSCGNGKPNSDPEKVKAALEKKGYEVTLMEVNEGEMEKMLVASKENEKVEGGYDGIEIMWCKTEEAAVEFEKEAKNELEKGANVVGRSGKMVWIGTAQAIKDAR